MAAVQLSRRYCSVFVLTVIKQTNIGLPGHCCLVPNSTEHVEWAWLIWHVGASTGVSVGTQGPHTFSHTRTSQVIQNKSVHINSSTHSHRTNHVLFY